MFKLMPPPPSFAGRPLFPSRSVPTPGLVEGRRRGDYPAPKAIKGVFLNLQILALAADLSASKRYGACGDRAGNARWMQAAGTTDVPLL